MSALLERTVAPGVHQRACPSLTLPPFDATWVTLIRSGSRGALVDPGFKDPSDAEALLAWARDLGVLDIDRVLITHTHRDHVCGLGPVLDLLGPGVQVYVHPAEVARIGVQADVRPLGDGRSLVLGGALVRALHTPGHSPGHLAFEVRPAADPRDAPGPAGLVAGDLITGLGSPWIGLPEGDLGDYLASLERVRKLAPAWIAVAHGEAVQDPIAALGAAARHRQERLDAVVAALDEPTRLEALQRTVYGDVHDPDAPFVRSALLANLLHAMRELRVAHLGDDEDGPYLRRRGSD